MDFVFHQIMDLFWRQTIDLSLYTTLVGISFNLNKGITIFELDIKQYSSHSNNNNCNKTSTLC